MNVSDKRSFYGEMYRVLKPGGTLAIYDILAGPTQPVLFPAPWARLPGMSFLITPENLGQLLEKSGFAITSWRDTTAAGRTWFTAIANRIRESGLPPLGFHVLLGPDFETMAENQRRNLEDGRIVLAEVVCAK
jgi:MPBQ/MSBQ methyltransferase